METTPFINVFAYAVVCGLALYCAIMFAYVVHDLSYNSTRKQLKSTRFFLSLLFAIICTSFSAAATLVTGLQAVKYAIKHVFGG